VNEIVEGTVLFAPDAACSCESAFASDLMSDVLRYYMENTILITGLCTVTDHPDSGNFQYTMYRFRPRQAGLRFNASVGKGERYRYHPESGLTLFEVSGRLYQQGLKPVQEYLHSMKENDR